MKLNTEFPLKLIPLRLTVGKEQIDAFATMSGDFNPIHMDAVAAKSSGMRGVLAHGSLALNLIWESIERSFDLSANPGFCLDVRFKAPVYLDDTVESGGRRTSNTGDYEVWVCSQQDGKRVIEGTLNVSV